MANTYVLIASTTVGAGSAATIDFTSIPQTYTDLVLKLSPRAGDASEARSIFVSLNGSTASFTTKYLIGFYAATPESGTGARSLGYSTTNTASTFSNIEAYFPNYTSSAFKSISSDGATETNGQEGYKNITANLWSNTAAITSISLAFSAGNFVQHSTANLYGIKNS
jgi:hypothetical protein